MGDVHGKAAGMAPPPPGPDLSCHLVFFMLLILVLVLTKVQGKCVGQLHQGVSLLFSQDLDGLVC